MYLECRDLPGEKSVPAMRYVTPLGDYDSELPEWQALLDSIDVIEE